MGYTSDAAAEDLGGMPAVKCSVCGDDAHPEEVDAAGRCEACHPIRLCAMDCGEAAAPDDMWCVACRALAELQISAGSE